MLEVGLFWIGIILVIVAIFMLFLDSFQSRRIWAVISLVLIVPLIIHMLLNWSSLNVRKSFYILVIGLLAVLVSVSGGALSQLSFLRDHEVVQALEEKIAPPEEVPLSNQQQADTAALSVGEGYDPLLTGSEYEQLETNEIVPERKNQVVRKADPIARYELMTDDERMQAINKRVRITMTDGRVIEGKLTEIVDDSLIVESNVNGGSLGLSYKNDLIQSVAVRLVAGEELVVPKQQVIKEAVEELVEESVVVEPSVIDAQQPITDTEVLLNDIPPQTTPKIPEINSDIIIEQQPKIEVLDSSPLATEIAPETSVKIEDEVLENVEGIVDDTKLLDNIDGQ
jgi:hypothetical protein